MTGANTEKSKDLATPLWASSNEMDTAEFPSARAMFARMNELRAANPNEVFGYFTSSGDSWRLKYKISDSSIGAPSILFYTSWHSHPDGPMPETLGISTKVPQGLKQSASAVESLYHQYDEAASEKISLQDLLEFCASNRSKDVIALPPEHILIVEMQSAEAASPIKQLADFAKRETSRLNEHYHKLEPHPDPEFARVEGTLELMRCVIQKFGQTINDLGFSRMTKENWLAILQALKVPHRYGVASEVEFKP